MKTSQLDPRVGHDSCPGCDEVFQVLASRTIGEEAISAVLDDDGNEVTPESVIPVLEVFHDGDAAQPLVQAHIDDCEGYADFVAEQEAKAATAEAKAAAEKKAADDAAEAERKAIDEDRRVRVALLGLLEPTGGTK